MLCLYSAFDISSRLVDRGSLVTVRVQDLSIHLRAFGCSGYIADSLDVEKSSIDVLIIWLLTWISSFVFRTRLFPPKQDG